MRGGNLRRHATKVDLDLRKTFEHVDRATLRTIAAKMSYPLVPLDLSLLSYAWPMRLAIGKAVGPPLFPREGNRGGVGLGCL